MNKAVPVVAVLLLLKTAQGGDRYATIRQDIEREIAAGRATGLAVAAKAK